MPHAFLQQPREKPLAPADAVRLRGPSEMPLPSWHGWEKSWLQTPEKRAPPSAAAVHVMAMRPRPLQRMIGAWQTNACAQRVVGSERPPRVGSARTSSRAARESAVRSGAGRRASNVPPVRPLSAASTQRPAVGCMRPSGSPVHHTRAELPREHEPSSLAIDTSAAPSTAPLRPLALTQPPLGLTQPPLGVMLYVPRSPAPEAMHARPRTAAARRPSPRWDTLPGAREVALFGLPVALQPRADEGRPDSRSGAPAGARPATNAQRTSSGEAIARARSAPPNRPPPPRAEDVAAQPPAAASFAPRAPKHPITSDAQLVADALRAENKAAAAAARRAPRRRPSSHRAV